MVDVTAVYNNFIQYVFGNEILAALGFLLIVSMIGIRYRWSLETYTIVFVPLITVSLSPILESLGLTPLMLMGMGILIGFGLLAIIRR